MADLANPIVNALYACGCSFEDETPVAGRVAFRFNADQSKLFALAQKIFNDGAVDREALIRIIERFLRRPLTNPEKNFVRTATRNQLVNRIRSELYDVDNPVARNPVTTNDGSTKTFPAVPPSCPRHGDPVVSVSSSYIVPVV